MSWSATDIADLVTSTLKDLGRLKWTDLLLDWQELYALPQLLKKERVSMQSGIGIQHQLAVNTVDNAKNVKLGQVDDVNFGDTMTSITVPWRHTTTAYPFERREVLMNRDPARILDLIKARRITHGIVPLAKKVETNFWGTISDDGETPFGVQYWIVYNASTGFYGGNHSAFSAGPGGLSATTYSRWRNWTAQYTSVTKEDLIAKWRQAYRECGWMPASPDIPQYDRGARRWVNYVNGETIQALETIGESQNENLGRDLASMDGQMTFRRTPIQWVPYLESYSTSDPIWMIDWSVFYFVVLDGDYLHESTVFPAAKQHNMTEIHIDLTYNTICDNRRRLGLIAKADPANGI
ncbi:MAG: phage major capsid protein [Pseudomonadota bacterium]